VFLIVPGDPESGAFYVYDRRARIWFWVDFDDEKFEGYSVNDFDRLVKECRFLDIVERPLSLMTRKKPEQALERRHPFGRASLGVSFGVSRVSVFVRNLCGPAWLGSDPAPLNICG